MKTYTTKSAINYKNICLAVIQKYPKLTKKQDFELTSLSTSLSQCIKDKRNENKRALSLQAKRERYNDSVQLNGAATSHSDDSENETQTVAKHVRLVKRISGNNVNITSEQTQETNSTSTGTEELLPFVISDLLSETLNIQHLNNNFIKEEARELKINYVENELSPNTTQHEESSWVVDNEVVIETSVQREGTKEGTGIKEDGGGIENFSMILHNDKEQYYQSRKDVAKRIAGRAKYLKDSTGDGDEEEELICSIRYSTAERSIFSVASSLSIIVRNPQKWMTPLPLVDTIPNEFCVTRFAG
ncbi:unnamed protein product [Didymodactylos carnosus]|uniref:Uncharacterized protein n=1 Tax=Didymodactylos carnosus TaxID=1234261 RepID=A0A8S2MJJ6_9BILA|nr:unnamed protein product [Didymodactylos carnosus]CAF3956323.1 unnamed protein product [Didymodactylos carnosus]